MSKTGAPGHFRPNSPQFLKELYIDKVSYINTRYSDGILIGSTGTLKELINLWDMQRKILLIGPLDKMECRPHVKERCEIHTMMGSSNFKEQTIMRAVRVPLTLGFEGGMHSFNCSTLCSP
jgi:hypothetical protein